MRTKKPKFEEYTIKEFMEEYRPDGYGHIKVCDYAPIYFKEIICDICNMEITEDPINKEKKVIFLLDTYALCSCCMNKVKDDYKKHG